MLAALWLSAAAAAQELTVEAATERVLMSHPELARWRARVNAAAAERDVEALPSPWVVGAEYEGPLGIGDAPEPDEGEGTLRLSRVIERGGKRELRESAGQARLDRDSLEAELQYLELAAETVRRFTDVVMAEQEVRLGREQVQITERLLERVGRRVEAARSPVAEAHSARAELARAQADLARKRGGLEAARARLAALWGGDGADVVTVAGDLFVLPAVPSREAVRASLANNPDLQRLGAEQSVARAEAELARSKRSADVTASAGAKYLGDLDTGGFVVEFNLPLGTASRAAPAVRAAEQRLAATEQELAARRRQADGVAMELLSQLRSRQRELELFTDAVVPEAAAAVREYRQGFEAGRHSYIAVVDAQRRLMEAREEAVAVAGAYHRLLLELERLTYSVSGGRP